MTWEVHIEQFCCKPKSDGHPKEKHWHNWLWAHLTVFLMEHHFLLFEVMSYTLWLFRLRYLAEMFSKMNLSLRKWVWHFKGNKWHYLLLMITFELSRENQNFWKTCISLHELDSCQVLMRLVVILTYVIFKYCLRKYVNIWQFCIPIELMTNTQCQKSCLN